MNKILVPIDGSNTSIKAAEKAIEIAKKFGSSITFITIAYEPDPNIYFKQGIKYDSVLEKANKKIREKEGKILDAILAKFDLEGLNYDKVIRSGEAYIEILNFTEEGNFDLIVMGRKGFSKVQRFFLGSVTQRVVSEATCPVLVVHE